MGLVTNVDRDTDGGEGLHGTGQRHGAGHDGRQTGHLVHERRDRFAVVRVVTEDDNVGLKAGVELLHLRRREMVEGANHARVRQGVGDLRGHRTARWVERQEFATFARQRVNHRDDDLAGQLLAQGRHRGHGRVPRGGNDDEVGTGGLLVGAAANEASAVNDYFGRHCRGALSVTRAQNYVVTSASEAQTDTLSSRTGTAQNSNRRHY